MVRIYTRSGDKGLTRDYAGNSIKKSDCLVEVQGKIDELQSSIDILFSFKNSISIYIDCLKPLDYKRLEKIQINLWQLAGELALHKVGQKVTKPIKQKDVIDLEKWIDEANIKLTGFIRFRSHPAIWINEARVRCRNLERVLTTYLEQKQVREVTYKYINRLSDYFFALAYDYETYHSIYN